MASLFFSLASDFLLFFFDMPYSRNIFAEKKYITFPNKNIKRTYSFMTITCEQIFRDSEVICIWTNLQKLSWTFLHL